MEEIHPIIPVFIASPREVENERIATKDAIQSIAHRFSRLFGITLVPLLWESFAPISSYDATHPQVGILRRIQPFSIFIGILWNKCGTPVGDNKETGTEMEFDHALKHRNTISILTYFRNHKRSKQNNELKEQQRKVNELKRKLESQNVTTVTYSNLDGFKERIVADIMEACLELILSKEPKKISDYYKFFLFGSHWRLASRTLFIVYPPITDPGIGYEKPKLDWRKRLLPHVIYEDFKAIQDIEEAMRLLGREYKTVTTDSPRLDLAEPGDRIWVCVPRNAKAHRVIEKLIDQGKKVRFQFKSISIPDSDQKSLETCLLWENNGNRIEIRSPLSKYLKYSARPDGEKEWKPVYGYSYCRDYAIIARFKMLKDPKDPNGEFFFHYFIGGIRGLGTWGIGYLIDHESSKLVRIADRQLNEDSSNDVQMLLEVTYENFRITRVTDVTDKEEDFFQTRYSEEYIKEQLLRHQDWLPGPICMLGDEKNKKL